MRAVIIVVAAVVAMIVIGVGLVGGLPPSEYGPPGQQFSVAFAHPPVVKTMSGGAIQYSTIPTRAELRGGTATQQVEGSAVVGSLAELLADPLYHRGIPLLGLLHRRRFRQVGDYEVARSPVTCNGAFCTGGIIVRRGQEIWLVAALGFEKPGVAEHFLASFQPVG